MAIKRSATQDRGFYSALFIFSLPIILLLALPLLKMFTSTGIKELLSTLKDVEVLRAIGRSLFTAGAAGLIALIFGTPLAYLLSRREFFGKRFVEGLIDLPIMIPHPVIGIAILGLAAKGTLIGDALLGLGLEIMGTYKGLILVLTFVGAPFYINSAKAGFEAVPKRLEHVSRSLGAGPWQTFFAIALPLSWRSLLIGIIMCMARAISEFGAVVIVAYHPMLASVLIYERFTAYGLTYSRPVAVWLILISMVLFVSMRLLSKKERTF